MVETTYRNFHLMSQYKGDKLWEQSRPENKNNHLIMVSKDGFKTTFEFWESISEKEIKTEEQLLYAFRCFLSDILDGEMDCEDFLEAFGYLNANEIRLGFSAYRGCKKSNKKWKSELKMDISEASDLLDQLSEDGIE